MKSTNRFYSSLALLILLNAVIKPLWVFAIDRQVQNQVGVSSYGVYFSLYNLSFVYVFLLDWGFTTFFNRQLAMQDRFYIDQPGNFLLLKFFFIVLYALLVMITAWISGVSRWDIVGYAVLIQVFTTLFLFFRSIITANHWFKTDAWLSVLDKSIMILFCGCLLYFPSLMGGISIDRFLFLQSFSMGFAALAAFLYLVRRQVRFVIRENWVPGWTLFKKVFPFGLIVLLMSAHSRLDAFLLERLNEHGAYEAGIYAGAFRLLDAANMVGILFGSFLLPYISRLWSEKKDINPVILNSRNFLMMFAVGIVCAMVLLAPWVQQALYHHKDDYSVKVLQWCLPALIGYSLTLVYGTTLTATGHITTFCYVVFLSLLINLVFNILLIPNLGAMGCCIAALCSQSFCGIVTMLYTKQKLELDLDYRSILVYIFTGLILWSGLYVARDWIVNKWLLIAMAGLFTILVMFLTKLSDPRLLLIREKNNN